MVSTWAEKEFRNLQRLHLEGISVPKPVLLKVFLNDMCIIFPLKDMPIVVDK
jgi:serine/threonine-protein kinase RIO1